MKPLIYIAHPFRNDPPGNTEKVSEICREIYANGKVIPISPIHLFSWMNPEDEVMEECLRLMDLCDDVWFYGDFRNSEGCRMEMEHERKKKSLWRRISDALFNLR